MADTDRTATHDLIEHLTREPYRFDFFEALRVIECHHRDKPRLGKSVKASDDPVRLAQQPGLDFAPSTVAGFEYGADGLPPRLSVRFLGLFGPNGPLPLHLTEYARERVRHHGDRTFSRFADVFHHRMLCLFYRAWADAQPTVCHDRPESDRFAAYLGSLFGIGVPSVRNRDAMPDSAKLYFTGHLSVQTKHPEGLQALIGDFFRIPVTIREFVGEWMEVALHEQSRLGISPHSASLGMSVVVGARVWGCQHKFRIVLGPMGLEQYRAMLPGGKSLVELIAIVRNYVGDELVWDLNLVLRNQEVPSLQLDGSAQLGWTSWLGTRQGEKDADDLRLNPYFQSARL
ncbi:type VI secretion system baseplate subunit TssG [Methylocaldum szegediense]|uniref:Type VI secretion system protein ImpH n=1 Tax=Methylocaldum szegediense TaxID=73780 RepID=A0ABM9HZV8_9GAMM|nr:type VI secretion system baseplate subunit TssG [Methylocaldum szegediense]CAI8797599.1 type VI secretion system protein ImpH [Methylocaldum szegediense]